MKTRRFEILDGMRGIAALSVMLYHYGMDSGIKLFWNASAAVDLFFILSGFVIAHSYGERIGANISGSRYLYKRVVRLYPMFLLSLIVGSVTLYFMGGGVSDYNIHSILTSFSLNAVFLPYFNSYSEIIGIHYISGDIFPANGPLWSLCFEMVASIAFLVLYRRSTRVLSVLSLCSLVALAVGQLVVFHDSPGGIATSNFIGGFSRVSYGFCLGIILYRLHLRVKEDHLSLYGRVKSKSAIIYAVMLVCFSCPFFFKGAFNLLLIVLVAPPLVFAGSLTLPSSKTDARFAEFLGSLSYPLYCLHIPVFRGLFVLNQWYGHFGNVPLLLTAAVLSVALSVVLTKFYDEPLRRFLSGPRLVARQVAVVEAC